jgi:hypothetical protein
VIAGFAFVLFYATGAFAAANVNVNINVDYVRKSVVFLYGADTAGKVDPNQPLGTGFILEIPRVSDPSRAWKLVVTARHVADPHWANCGTSAGTTIFMRVNKRNFGVHVSPPTKLISVSEDRWCPNIWGDNEIGCARGRASIRFFILFG